MCGCCHCRNRKEPICGRYPDFLNKEDCEQARIEWDEDTYVDCSKCDYECPTIVCVYFEEDNDEREY